MNARSKHNKLNMVPLVFDEYSCTTLTSRLDLGAVGSTKRGTDVGSGDFAQVATKVDMNDGKNGARVNEGFST